MSDTRTLELDRPTHGWLPLLLLAGVLEGAALWLALRSSWYAPVLAHVAATGAAAEALRGWAPAAHRQSAARAAWTIGLAIPFAAVLFVGLVAWATRFDRPTDRGPSAEDQRRESARQAAARRARRRTVSGAVASLRDALESPDRDARIAAVEALRGRSSPASMRTLARALDNSLFEVRTQAAHLIEAISADYGRRLGAARQDCSTDICRPEQRMELVELLLEYGAFPQHTGETRRSLANEAAAHARKLPRTDAGGRETELLLECLLAAGRTADAELAAARVERDAPSPELRRVLARIRFAARDIEGARALLQKTPTASIALDSSGAGDAGNALRHSP